MTTSGDFTVVQDGGAAKFHPYFIAFVRWCASYLWSSATLVLHRLMTAPLSPIAATKPVKRPAGKDHLDPEPRVECVVLHQPESHELDVIFVHGLYGSLVNTWRQGEWRSKYAMGPQKVHLRRPSHAHTACSCQECTQSNTTYTLENETSRKVYDDKFTNVDENVYENLKNIIPNDDVFTTEKFYNNDLLDQVEILDNYDTQAKFVSDLFRTTCHEEQFCESVKFNQQNVKCEGQSVNRNEQVEDERYDLNLEQSEVDCKCKTDEKQCEVGCGCICDDCYSPCWPKDWIKIDYPNARVISINYTSDPHLWRPLWIKENKRLRLHERAEQMTQQLLALGVGEKPVVWVGHSKGGLFIKQIYCEAYEAYLKCFGEETRKTNQQTESHLNNPKNNEQNFISNRNYADVNIINNKNADVNGINNRNADVNVINSKNVDINIINSGNVDDIEMKGDANEIEMGDGNSVELRNDDAQNMGETDHGHLSSKNQGDHSLECRAGLWRNSIGFMFYSVPHRGSVLADFKTPITARSVELLEISKDCSLVVALHRRWLGALQRAPAAAVRSLVETRRTLMAVLWLRIVSEDSADPGIGALCGVSVDHREICKPSSRQCLLYTELATLIQAALKQRNL